MRSQSFAFTKTHRPRRAGDRETNGVALDPQGTVLMLPKRTSRLSR